MIYFLGLDDVLSDVGDRLDVIDESQLNAIDKHTDIVEEMDQLPRG